MMLFNYFSVFPLQVDVTAMWQDPSGNDAAALGIIAVVAVVAIIVVNILKGKSGGSSTSAGSSKSAGSAKSAAASPGLFSGLLSGFAVNRIANEIGLNYEQKKMLKYVFRTDDVKEPEKSIINSTLLDRHFRRAYRAIQTSSASPDDIQNRLAVLFSTRNVLEYKVSGEVTSTQQIKDDTTLIINAGKEKYSVSIASTKGEHLAVESPKNALGSVIKFERGNQVNVMFFTKNNKGFSFESKVMGYSSKLGQSTLLLSHSKQLRFLSQRRYRRRHTAVPCNCFLVNVEGTGKKQRLIVDKRTLAGNIADISVGGCSIKTKSPVPVGVKLKIEFNKSDTAIAALGQVLRTNRAGAVAVIHIKFLKVSRKSMNAINAFVYEFANE